MLDCIVVGGGPAGLSAALLLGRARRHVLVCDAGQSRNRWSRSVHGFLTREGTAPDVLLALAREELSGYGTVAVRSEAVTDAARTERGFRVTLGGGEREEARALLLATGVVDDIPPIEGLLPLYGVTVHHCPYCDGWEHRDRPLAVYGCGESAMKFALAMTTWSRDVVWCSDGPSRMGRRSRERMRLHGISVREERVLCLEGTDGQLERIVFQDGPPLGREALFFSTGQRQGSGLAAQLGCRFNARGTVETRTAEGTNIPGLYVAGDASRNAQLVIVAAAEGAEAAVAIHTDLLKADLAQREGSIGMLPDGRSGV